MLFHAMPLKMNGRDGYWLMPFWEGLI